MLPVAFMFSVDRLKTVVLPSPHSSWTVGLCLQEYSLLREDKSLVVTEAAYVMVF